MIMVRAIVRPEKVDDVLAALMDAGFPAVTKMDVYGRGKQRGMRIGEVTYDELPKELILVVVRDADKGWLRDLFSFAVQPDLVFYLQLGVEQLVPRVLEAGKMNYWESGLDMNWGDDLYDSFVAYQGELIHQFDIMAEEFAFHCVDARQDPRAIQRELRQAVTAYLESCNYSAPGAVPRR